MNRRPVLAPSLLAADFADLRGHLRAVTQAGAGFLHFDVMDGHFVPNISFGAPVLRGVRPFCPLPFDVHLMISQPLRYLEMFAEAGADILNVHLEAEDSTAECLNAIHALGKRSAVTLKPLTPAETAFPYLDQISMVLVMSVEPGFGGQAFRTDMLRKAETLSGRIARHGLNCDVEMDGGLGPDNIGSAMDAGANVIVAGSAVFADSPERTEENARALMRLMR